MVALSERYIVEFGGEAYGILDRQEGMLIFHTTHERVSHLDGQTYPDVDAGRVAVERAARERAA